MSTAVAALGALAQETRLAAFRLLVQAGPCGLAAGEISRRLSLPPATASFHLAQLEQSGLVSPHREGRSIIYAADFAEMKGLMDFLLENCCQGQAGCRPRGGVGVGARAKERRAR